MTSTPIIVNVEYNRERDIFIFYDLPTVQLVWGASSIPQDVKDIHKVKDGRGYFITRKDLMKRLEKLREKQFRINSAIDSMTKIIGGRT